MNRCSLRVTAACAGCAASLVAGAASAQTSALGSDWRRPSAAKSVDEGRFASPQNFAFEVRFGAYTPDVDDEFGGTGPYARAFGDDLQFYFGLELDWLPLRIPYVGVIGPGLGWGFTSVSEVARIAGTEERSAQETSLTVMPMHLSAVVRFDELMRRTGIPVVPYAKGGLGFGLWTADAGESTSTYEGIEGKDTTWGTHFALGGMLALNFLDRRSAVQLDETTGVNHFYLFGEWMLANLTGIGSRPQMNIGDSTWAVGLAFDM